MTPFRPAITLLTALTLLTGILYPLAITGVAHILFPDSAEGSLVKIDGKVRGSRLIGQSFTDPKYFWDRPSATAPLPYDASASTGSNQGPSNPDLATVVRRRVDALRQADPTLTGSIPVDLVTASGSGLDPHISVAAAVVQIPRVARSRKISTADLQRLINDIAESRTWGILGEPRVNVLLLNIALDRLK